jgi:hypothetical protein
MTHNRTRSRAAALRPKSNAAGPAPWSSQSRTTRQASLTSGGITALTPAGPVQELPGTSTEPESLAQHRRRPRARARDTPRVDLASGRGTRTAGSSAGTCAGAHHPPRRFWPGSTLRTTFHTPRSIGLGAHAQTEGHLLRALRPTRPVPRPAPVPRSLRLALGIALRSLLDGPGRRPTPAAGPSGT